MDPVASSSPEPPVIRIRVTVRVPDLDAFITRYSRHLAGDRIFIFTKTPQPVGTRVRFSLHLADGEPIIHGKGTVTRVQEGEDARHPPGMELVFVTLDDRSQTIVDFMHAARLGTVENMPALARAVVPPRPPAIPPPVPLPPPPSAKAVVESAPAAEPATPASVESAAQPPAEAPPPPAAPTATAPTTAGEESVRQRLADLFGPFAARAHEPVAPGPAPTMAEAWREPLAPGPPAALPAGEVPANPFSDVSDNAIDYFVEWSLEQSIGPRAEKTSTFSNVPMSLPLGATGAVTAIPDDDKRPVVPPEEAAPARRGRGWALALGGFLVGAPAGGLVMRLVAAPPAPATPVVAAAPTEPAPAATPTPPAEPPAPAPTATLTVTTRPPGAEVTVDGKPAGTTPLKATVAPGKHELTITRDRYDSITQTVDAPGALTLDLKRPLYTLQVNTTPPGATVTVAGVQRGRTPIAVKLPGFERYDVRVALATSSWRRIVYLKDPSMAIAFGAPAKRSAKSRPLLAPLAAP